MYITSPVKICKEIIDSLVECKFFNAEDYIWLIGVNHLNNIIEVYNNGPTYFPFTRKTDSTGKLFYIDYRIVPNNDTLKLVRKTGNLYPNFIVASRQSGKTNMQLKYLEEMMRKWNRGIVNNNQSIKNVIFNNPATIVFWSDGTKTVVKAEGEPFDPEKGLAMAIAKKSLGNKGDYYDEFKKWLPKEEAKWKGPAKKVCSSCKYNEQTDTQLRCFTCEYAGVAPLEQPCCDCAKNMGFSYYREKKDD